MMMSIVAQAEQQVGVEAADCICQQKFFHLKKNYNMGGSVQENGVEKGFPIQYERFTRLKNLLKWSMKEC
jgi:hypothetical protein